MRKKTELRDERAEWLKGLRGPRHWRMSDVDRLVREAEELGEEPRDYAIGLGLVRGRVDRWLRRHAEITAHANTSMFALSTAPTLGAERTLEDAFVELRASNGGAAVATVDASLETCSVVLVHLAGGVMVEVPASREGARFVAAVAAEAAIARDACC